MKGSDSSVEMMVSGGGYVRRITLEADELIGGGPAGTACFQISTYGGGCAVGPTRGVREWA
jgi:hypothetical protein